MLRLLLLRCVGLERGLVGPGLACVSGGFLQTCRAGGTVARSIRWAPRRGSRGAPPGPPCKRAIAPSRASPGAPSLGNRHFASAVHMLMTQFTFSPLFTFLVSLVILWLVLISCEQTHRITELVLQRVPRRQRVSTQADAGSSANVPVSGCGDTFPSPGQEQEDVAAEREQQLPSSAPSRSLLPPPKTGASPRGRCSRLGPRHPDGVCCRGGCCEAKGNSPNRGTAAPQALSGRCPRPGLCLGLWAGLVSLPTLTLPHFGLGCCKLGKVGVQVPSLFPCLMPLDVSFFFSHLLLVRRMLTTDQGFGDLAGDNARKASYV